MNAEPLFHDLSNAMKSLMDEDFDRYVTNARGQHFECTFSGLTKDDILASKALRKLWWYWYRSVPKTFGSTSRALEFYTWRYEYSGRKLQSLVYRLWRLAQLSDEEVALRVEEIEVLKNRVSSSNIGKLASAIDLLQDAALILGYAKDHFYRQMRVTSIRRVEGESDEELNIRKRAADAHRLLQTIDYPSSQKKQTSTRMFALRRIWPLLSIDVPTLKLLFMTENGTHAHGAAIRSILEMSSPDYKMQTVQIENFLNKQK